MTASVIQCLGSTAAITNASSCGVTLPGTSSGNAIAAFIILGGTASITAVADGTNGSYGAAKDTLTDAPDGYIFASYLKANIAGGTVTVSATFNFATTQYGIIAFEVGGVVISPFDGHAGQYQATPGTGTDAVTTGNGTNATQPALIVAVGWSAAITLAGGTSFTGIGGSSGAFTGSSSLGGSFFAEYLRVTSATTHAATWTASGAARALSAMMMLDEQVVVASGSNSAQMMRGMGS